MNNILIKLVSFTLIVLRCSSKSKIATQSPADIRNDIVLLHHNGQYNDLIHYLEAIEKESRFNYSLVIDNKQPSLYSYRGVALASHVFRDKIGAVKAFENATFYFPNDTRSWINLGEVNMNSFGFKEAIRAFEHAEELGDVESLPRLLKAISWICAWEKYENISLKVEKATKHCYVQAIEKLPTFSSTSSISIIQIIKRDFCKIDSTLGFEFTNINGTVQKLFHMNSLNARPSDLQIDLPLIPSSFLSNTQSRELNKRSNSKRKNVDRYRVKVAILSSDFGVHPVSSLIRGGLHFIDRQRIEVYVFSLQPELSYWGSNISQIVEHFHVIGQMNTFDAAKFIASYNIDILIDLNGHTLHTGLAVMKHKPAYIQLSFLGLPTTTGANFIDYYMTDWISTPIEIADHFTEKLLLLPPCYIVNDYAQMQGDILFLSSNPTSILNNNIRSLPVDAPELGPSFQNPLESDRFQSSSSHRNQHNFRSSYKALHIMNETDVKMTHKHILFGTLSNSQKFDPLIFQVWMNVLSRVPGSKMMYCNHHGVDQAFDNFIKYSLYHGHPRDRIGLTPSFWWIDHMHTKTAFDLILDTTAKNGHTTGLDGLWAGVPTISIGSGKDTQVRAAESMAVALGSELGIGYSFKEYENLAVYYSRDHLASNALSSSLWRDHFTKHHRRDLHHARKDQESDNIQVPDTEKYPYQMRILREYSERLRATSSLFDSKLWSDNFARMMEATWEVYHEAYRGGQPDKRYHIFAMSVVDIFSAQSSVNAHTTDIVTSNNSLSAAFTAKILPDSEASLVYTKFSSNNQSAAMTHLINASQAIEKGAPFWSATHEAKHTYKWRFGYDPEDVYRSADTAAVAYRMRSLFVHDNEPSEAHTQHQQPDHSQGKFKKYKARNHNTAAYTSADGDNTDGSNDIALSRTAGKSTRLTVDGSEATATTRVAKQKYDKYKKKLQQTIEVVDASDEAATATSTIAEATMTPSPACATHDINCVPSLTVPLSDTRLPPPTTATSVSESRYHYQKLCEPYSAPPLDQELIQRLQAVLDERKLNMQRIKNRENQIAINPNYNPNKDQENELIYHPDNLIYLNIGGLRSAGKWINVNADMDSFKHFLYEMNEESETEGKHQIHVKRKMNDLHGFPNASVTALYASHILEHNTFGDRMIIDTLLEWRRVLRPGGLLFVSVPDLTILSKLFLLKDLTLTEKFFIMKMMFGGQGNAYDHHHIGMDEEMLNTYLALCGFCEIERVGAFNLFNSKDTSSSAFRQYEVSLNVVARSCPSHDLSTLNLSASAFYIPSDDEEYDEMKISHSASKYVFQEIKQPR